MNIFKRFFTISSITVLTFFVTFLLVSTAMWLYNSYTFGNLSTEYRLITFVNKYQEAIKRDIFGTIFTQAKLCAGIHSENIKQICRKEVGTKIGDVLREEELADERGYDWPNDLFFVRQENNSFYQLGWDGELKDISSIVNRRLLQDKQSYISLILRRNCNYFRISAESYACEIYETVKLSNDSKGYTIRMFPFQEESDFRFALLMPLFGLIMLGDSSHYEYFGWEQLSFIALSFLNVVIPLIVSAFVFYIFKKRMSLKKGKVRVKKISSN